MTEEAFMSHLKSLLVERLQNKGVEMVAIPGLIRTLANANRPFVSVVAGLEAQLARRKNPFHI
jgi:hypothetical protein